MNGFVSVLPEKLKNGVFLLLESEGPSLFPFNMATKRHWIKVKPRQVEAQGPPLSGKVSFVGIDPVDWTLSVNNQRLTLHFQSALYLLYNKGESKLR